MGKKIQTVKKTILFLFGVFFILWGGKSGLVQSEADAQYSQDEAARK